MGSFKAFAHSTTGAVVLTLLAVYVLEKYASAAAGGAVPLKDLPDALKAKFNSK
jgi:hypothetical protein